jgi:hypothetical protein
MSKPEVISSAPEEQALLPLSRVLVFTVLSAGMYVLVLGVLHVETASA